MTGDPPASVPEADELARRRYPVRPVVAVSGVVILPGRGVLLVQRRHPPLADAWSLPGGVLELGESLLDGVARELHEETGLIVEPGPVVDVVDHVERDPDGRVTYHYVIVDYLCRVVAGAPLAAGDAADVAVAPLSDLETYALTPRTRAVIERAIQLATRVP